MPPNNTKLYDLKLKRLETSNERLKGELRRPRVKVSEASSALIAFCGATHDPLLPSVWLADKGSDPYAPQPVGGGCECIVM